MLRRLAFLAPLLLLVAGLPAPAPAQEGAAVELSRTAIHYFLPFTDDGLNDELTVRAEETGRCDGESIVAPGRPDAWSCISTESAIYDPCFQNPFSTPDDPGPLACVESPFDRDVVLLTPDRPLPVAKERADTGSPDKTAKPPKPNMALDEGSAAPLPWALELAGGERCTIARGATAAFAGMRINYFCAGGVILGEPDQTLPVWAVHYLPTGGLETDLVGVAAVWP